MQIDLHVNAVELWPFLFVELHVSRFSLCAHFLMTMQDTSMECLEMVLLLAGAFPRIALQFSQIFSAWANQFVYYLANQFLVSSAKL